MSTKQGIARSVQVKTCFTSEKPLHVKPRGIKKKRKSKRASKGKNWRRVSKSKHAKHHDQKHTFSHHSIKQSSQRFTSLPARTSSIISTATMDQDQAQLVNPAQSFWLNYKHATAWQNKHFMNYWKSRCAALELENQHLYRTIQNLTQSHTYSLNLETEGDPTQLPDLDIDKNIQREEEKMEEPNESKQVHEETCQGNSEECTEGNEDDNFSFEVNDELIEFLAISAKHKMDLKKKKESELEKEAAELAQKAPIKEKLPREIMEERKVEMEKLYGADSAPMILGMETAMQLSFDKFIDKHQPKHWPNIPLNP